MSTITVQMTDTRGAGDNLFHYAGNRYTLDAGLARMYLEKGYATLVAGDLVHDANMKPGLHADSTGYVQGLTTPDGMRKARLFPARNFRSCDGETLYTFNDHSALTGVSTPTLATDSVIKWEGDSTVSITTPSAGATCGVQKDSLATPLRIKSMILPVYIEDYTKVEKIQVYLSQGAALTPNYSHYSYLLGTNASHKYNGWHLVEMTENMLTNAGTGLAADGTTVKVIRVDIKAVSGETCTVRLGRAILNPRSRANILFTFDDGRISQYKAALPILSKYDIPATCYIIPAQLGADGFMTEAQVEYLASLGWCIANHANHPGVGTSDSFSEIGLSTYAAQVATCRDWLAAHGYDGARHHAYVEGAYDGTLATALQTMGMHTARTIAGNVSTGAQGMSTQFGCPRRFALHGGLQLNSSNLVAAVQTEVDRAIRDGKTLIITAHDIRSSAEGGAGAAAYLDTDFETLVAYVASKRADGLCDARTVSDWYSHLVHE